MIIDSIKNARIYFGIAPGIEKALKWLESQDFSSLVPGRYEIEGDEIFAMVQDYETVPKEEKRWEAHRKYIDVQFIASGTELMGFSNIVSLETVEEYNDEKDITWLEGEGDFATAEAGNFVILFPHDAHMPGCAVGKPELVRKVVVKVRI